ncbi:hypothetical protein B0H14DRAFT_3441290 [Mycena olivaceomarginata]|nr:hypothetical protein B0H14DRAFT_3441290 [Mycena olivaceomarginata]
MPAVKDVLHRSNPNAPASLLHEHIGESDLDWPTGSYALERNPEAKYKYFPTDDPLTWERTDVPAGDLNNQAATWQDGSRWAGGYAVSGGRAVATGGNSVPRGLPAQTAATTRSRMGPGPFGAEANRPNMRQTRLEEVVGPGPLITAVNVGEGRGVEEATCGTDEEDVDEEEAGFRVIEARIAKQRADRARKREERAERGGGMANIVFSDDGERRPETGTGMRGFAPAP